MFLTAMTFLRGINLKTVLYAAGAAILAYFIYFAVGFVDDKYEAEREVDRLELVIRDREADILVLQQAAEQKDSAIDTADAVRIELDAVYRTYEEIQREAATVKEEDDGPVAPVLRSTLRALDGLHGTSD